MIEDERVFLLVETDRLKHYKVINEKRQVYDVIFIKASGEYLCNCGNILEKECYHILAIERLENYEKTLNMSQETNDFKNNINLGGDFSGYPNNP